jgi:hypothetical protein
MCTARAYGWSEYISSVFNFRKTGPKERYPMYYTLSKHYLITVAIFGADLDIGGIIGILP